MSKKDEIYDLVKAGVTDREVMAQSTGLTLEKVRKALQNLQCDGRIIAVKYRSAGRGKGRLDTVYGIAPKPRARSAFAGVSNIFGMTA